MNTQSPAFDRRNTLFLDCRRSFVAVAIATHHSNKWCDVIEFSKVKFYEWAICRFRSVWLPGKGRGPEKQLFDSWKLQIAGFGDAGYENLIQRRILDHKLSSSVEVLGLVTGERKEQTLANADGFILPSHSEGLPMSILEAWAYRQPVIMTSACNLDIGFQENAAVEIEPRACSIASGLIDFFRMSQAERNSIGQNGFQLVKDRFQWSAIASQMADMYRSLVSVP